MFRKTRVDPIGCCCNKCCFGSSIPVDAADLHTIVSMMTGTIENATGMNWELDLTSDFPILKGTTMLTFAVPRGVVSGDLMDGLSITK